MKYTTEYYYGAVSVVLSDKETCARIGERLKEIVAAEFPNATVKPMVRIQWLEFKNGVTDLDAVYKDGKWRKP